MPEATIEQLLKEAFQHHQQGRLAPAEAIYRQILAKDPKNPHALHYLGVMAVQLKRFDTAIDLIERSVAIAPGMFEAHSNLGVAWQGLNRHDKAAECYARALQLSPGFSAAAHNLGKALDKLERYDEAMPYLLQALKDQPDNPEIYFNVAGIQQRKKNDVEAEGNYRRAIELRPDYAEAFNNLCNLLVSNARFEEAGTLFNHALSLRPDSPEIHYSAGNSMFLQGKFSAAIPYFEKAIQLKPEFALANNYLGATLQQLGQHDRALAQFQKALSLNPADAVVHSNVGTSLSALGKYDAALQSFIQATVSDPNSVKAHIMLGAFLRKAGYLSRSIETLTRAIELDPMSAEAFSHRGSAYEVQGELDAAMADYQKAHALQPTHPTPLENIVFNMSLDPRRTKAEIFSEHRRWNDLYAAPIKHLIQPLANDRSSERPLRIGYVSADFREHSVAYFVLPLIETHDHTQFHVVCYSMDSAHDKITERFKHSADDWREIAGLNNDQAAELIRRDKVDILVDLTGHTGGNRLAIFAQKPAPIQVTYLGYFNTTGMATMDYWITDALNDPPGQTEAYCSEALLRLPDTFACYSPPENSPEIVPESPAARNGYVTFGSFNGLFKMNDQVIELWAGVLRAVPMSRLFIQTVGMNDKATRALVTGKFASHDIAEERLEFLSRQSVNEHLATVTNRVDICLDTFPFTGHTISLQALWMGVPLVTLAGDRHVARRGVSVLTNLGLTKLIATDEREYLRIAVEWASDIPRLAEFRRTIRQRMAKSPIMDYPRFARHVEAAYRQLWRTFCEKPA